MDEVYFALPELGELTVEHSFYLLDGEPILFVCKNANEQRFLCSCYQMGTGWVIGNVRESDLIDLIDDQISIREVFEHCCAVKFAVSWDENNFVVNPDVSNDILPRKGALLELNNEKSGCYREGCSCYKKPTQTSS